MNWAKSVPWSRLKPRRKYWLALPPPECWVAMKPGMTSSSSPIRWIGRSARSTLPICPSDADLARPIRLAERPVTTMSETGDPATAPAAGPETACAVAPAGSRVTSVVSPNRARRRSIVTP